MFGVSTDHPTTQTGSPTGSPSSMTGLLAGLLDCQKGLPISQSFGDLKNLKHSKTYG